MIVSTNSTGPPLKDFDPHEQSPDLQSSQTRWPFDRVSVHGAKSLGGHFAWLCWGFDLYEDKQKNIISQREKGNIFTPIIIFL
jgi:hypothetical protein